ncbi:MAG: hypothetical protein ACI9ES_001263, partial [Oceanospirillaceae bacterium]
WHVTRYKTDDYLFFILNTTGDYYGVVS